MKIRISFLALLLISQALYSSVVGSREVDFVEFNFDCPEKVMLAPPMLDGGTVGLILTNHLGKEYRLCLDRQAVVVTFSPDITPENRLIVEREREQKIYLRVAHPQDGGVALDFKGADEIRLVEIMKGWIDCVGDGRDLLLGFIDDLGKERLREIHTESPNKQEQ